MADPHLPRKRGRSRSEMTINESYYNAEIQTKSSNSPHKKILKMMKITKTNLHTKSRSNLSRNPLEDHVAGQERSRRLRRMTLKTMITPSICQRRLSRSPLDLADLVVGQEKSRSLRRLNMRMAPKTKFPKNSLMRMIRISNMILTSNPRRRDHLPRGTRTGATMIMNLKNGSGRTRKPQDRIQKDKKAAANKPQKTILKILHIDDTPPIIPAAEDLSAEDGTYLKEPRRVVRNSNKWEIVPGSQEYWGNLEVDRRDLPAVQYNENWSEDDEKKLWRTWREEDQASLDAVMEKKYLSVWLRTYHLYGVPAPVIFTGPMFVARDGMSGTKVSFYDRNENEHVTLYLEPRTWPQAICSELCAIMACVAFADSLPFLQYILQYTVSLRVGKERIPLPRRPKTTWISDRLADEDFDYSSADIAPELRKALASISRDMEYPHMDFTESLKAVIFKEKNKDVNIGFGSKDIKNIKYAWDENYIKNPEKKGRLKTIQEGSDDFNAVKGTFRGMAKDQNLGTLMCKQMRDYIIACRSKDRSKRRLEAEDLHVADEEYGGEASPSVRLRDSLPISAESHVGRTSQTPTERPAVEAEAQPVTETQSGERPVVEAEPEAEEEVPHESQVDDHTLTEAKDKYFYSAIHEAYFKYKS